jgi:ribonuclease HI
VRASLRGQVVWARADATGALSESGGKVEIRYKPNDGRRYDALAKNLTIVDPKPLPDETCGPAEKPAPADGAKKTSAESGAGTTPRSRGGMPRKSEAVAPKHPDGAVVVYADGACSGNPGPAGLGVVVLDGEERRELSEYLGTGTNNVAELTAVLRAIEMTTGEKRAVVLHTDSQYAIGVLAKGWKAKANVELVATIKRALAEHATMRLVYVPGHSGVALNEVADALARRAVETRRTSRSATAVRRETARDEEP